VDAMADILADSEAIVLRWLWFLCLTSMYNVLALSWGAESVNLFHLKSPDFRIIFGKVTLIFSYDEL
jgi:hypothetical protein